MTPTAMMVVAITDQDRGRSRHQTWVAMTSPVRLGRARPAVVLIVNRRLSGAASDIHTAFMTLDSNDEEGKKSSESCSRSLHSAARGVGFIIRRQRRISKPSGSC